MIVAGYSPIGHATRCLFSARYEHEAKAISVPGRRSLLSPQKAALLHSIPNSVGKESMRSARIRKSLRYAAAAGTAGTCRPTQRIRCPWLSSRGFESKYLTLIASKESRLGRGFCSSPKRANTALENRCFPAGDARPKYRTPWAYLSGTC